MNAFFFYAENMPIGVKRTRGFYGVHLTLHEEQKIFIGVVCIHFQKNDDEISWDKSGSHVITEDPPATTTITTDKHLNRS
jgi:hypothetical protein